jgi:hypothetical protein
MDIKRVFEIIAKEYPEAKKQKLKNHPLTKFIRTEVPKSFNEDLGKTISSYGCKTCWKLEQGCLDSYIGY